MSIRWHAAICVAALAIANAGAASQDADVNEQIARANAADKRNAEALPFDYRDLVQALLVDYIHSHSFPGKDHKYFVAVFGDDADPALIARLHESGVVVLPASAWTVPGGQERPARSSPLVKISVGAIQQGAPDTFRVKVGYSCGALCAASEQYTLQKDGEHWRVTDRQLEWIA